MLHNKPNKILHTSHYLDSPHGDRLSLLNMQKFLGPIHFLHHLPTTHLFPFLIPLLSTQLPARFAFTFAPLHTLHQIPVPLLPLFLCLYINIFFPHTAVITLLPFYIRPQHHSSPDHVPPTLLPIVPLSHHLLKTLFPRFHANLIRLTNFHLFFKSTD